MVIVGGADFSGTGVNFVPDVEGAWLNEVIVAGAELGTEALFRASFVYKLMMSCVLSLTVIKRGGGLSASAILAKSSGRGGGDSASGVSGCAGASGCGMVAISAAAIVSGIITLVSFLFLSSFFDRSISEMEQYIARQNVDVASATTAIRTTKAAVGIILRRGYRDRAGVEKFFEAGSKGLVESS